jgi:hypothetical protein
MKPNFWLLTTFSTVLIVGAAVVAVNGALDIYGLFRSSRGRSLTVVGDERVAKYLLCLRYVPENFDGLLSGASVSSNWDVKAIKALRVYNGSLNGGTIVEEKALIEAALDRPGISTVMLLVHPALTYSHEFRTVELRPELRRSALGSTSLWAAYRDMMNIHLGRIPAAFDYTGTETFIDGHTEMNTVMKAMWNTSDFEVDSVALQRYLDVVNSLRAHGVRVIFIVPATSETLLSTKRAAMERYVQRIRSVVGDRDELWIDFLASEYRDLCRAANFTDGVHFTSDGARQLVARLNTLLIQWKNEGVLMRSPRASVPTLN